MDSRAMQLMEAQVQALNRMSLPKLDIIKFDGDPFKYFHFLSLFECVIESNVSGEIERLLYLIQFTEGSVKSLVQCYIHGDRPQPYKDAKEAMQKRFGDDMLIALAYKKKLLDFPEIKGEDFDSLRDYTIELFGCINVMKRVNKINLLNNMFTLPEIISKLPEFIQIRWLNVAHEIMHEKNEDVTVDHVYDFIYKIEREINNPLFGYKSLGINLQQNRTSELKNESSPEETGECSTSQSQCYLCHGFHFLNQCKSFRDMNYQARKDFVIRNKLCFSCLSKNHSVKNCYRRKPCVKCRKFHTTLLHPPTNNSTTGIDNDNETDTKEPINESLSQLNLDDQNLSD